MSNMMTGGLSTGGIVDTYQTTSEYNLLSSVIADSGSNAATQLGVSTVTFDNLEELLWMGNVGGHVTSYYTYQLQKYTSFQTHQMNDVRALLTGDFGLLSLTQDTLRCSLRRGITVFNHKSELLKDMQSMTALPSGLILLGGQQKQLIEFDLERIKQLRITEIDEEGCVIIRQHPKFVCCGDVSGKIVLRDPNTLKVQHKFTAHLVTLSDFDVHGNYLISCGYSNRNNYVPDRFLMVYDLRMMRAVSPIHMMFSPYLLRFAPAFSTRFYVVSQTGDFQLMDSTLSVQTSYIHNVQLPPAASVTAFDVSSSCQAFAFADDNGIVYCYGASDEVNFNNYSQPTEFADPIEPCRPMMMDDVMTPYSSIMVPYSNEKLLSDWPANLMKKIYRMPKPIDPQILANMKMVGNICYAPNPDFKSRNQPPYSSLDTKIQPVNQIPSRYQMIEPNHNKVILDEYDFSRYNHSPFSGIDSTLPNSYSNNIIQALYFITPFRSSILNHLCHREFCLSCELSFLFYMLDVNGTQIPCQASNFLRTFRTMPEASALSLILPEDDDLKRKVNFPRLSQRWLRFILHQLHSELATPSNDVFEGESKSPANCSIINDLFGIEESSSYTCRCGNVWEQKTIKYPITLLYPDDDQIVDFNELLRRSLNAEKSMSAFCDKCNKFQYVVQKRSSKSIPDILAINCGLDNEACMGFWRKQIGSINGGNKESQKLTEIANTKKPCRYNNKCTRIGCKFYHERDVTKPETSTTSSSISNVASSVGEQQIESRNFIPYTFNMRLNSDNYVDVVHDREKDMECVTFQLTSVVSVIHKIDEPGKENIVCAIKVDELYNELKRAQSKQQQLQVSKDGWYLFNHFSINPITHEEVTHLDLDWKIPVILIYTRVDLKQRLKSEDLEVKNPITADVFRDDRSLAEQGHRGSITFTPLSADEMPKKGDIVAVDAEFVTLNQEETEIRSDGTKSTIKPPQRSVARITCVRGSGRLEGQPFVDDYIATQEQVADYMTKFSGIQPGDLDISISSKHLTTLKSTYLKLRFLVDTGVVFVGHGLKNDFRVINLVVPQGQIIDTVTLFQSPRFKRMVSLRFLAWHFLGEKIQSETHDSIEDAKTALLLYRKFQELHKMDRVNLSIEELYDAGRNSGWQVPSPNELK